MRQGSGGAGAFAGGDGLVREYEMLTDTTVTVLSERRRGQPYGAQGGEPGAIGRNTLIRDGREQALPGKIEMQLQPGDRLRDRDAGRRGIRTAIRNSQLPSDLQFLARSGSDGASARWSRRRSAGCSTRST